jgi:hypothetical protein
MNINVDSFEILCMFPSRDANEWGKAHSFILQLSPHRYLHKKVIDSWETSDDDDALSGKVFTIFLCRMNKI